MKSLLYGRSGDYPIYSKHAHIYGCALPPGLPSVVRECVISKFEDTPRERLDEVKSRSLSDCSEESNALSPLMLQYDIFAALDTPRRCG